MVEREKQQVIKQLIKLVETRFEKQNTVVITDFVRQYYKEVSLDDLNEREQDDLYGLVISHWNFAQKRESGKALVNVYNPNYETHGWQSNHTVIEVVSDNMPFIVNSLALNLNARGLTFHSLMHPVLNVARDKKGQMILNNKKDLLRSESFVHIEVDLQGSESGGLQEIQHQIEDVLMQCKAVSEDWSLCIKQLDDSKKALKRNPPKDTEQDVVESVAFLDWLLDDNFLFLGCREYQLVTAKKAEGFKIIEGSGKGILRDNIASLPAADVIPISAEVCSFMSEANPLLITKATSKSAIHRPAYMDYVGVKKFNTKGEVVGEYRFLGLYTSAAYKAGVLDVPLLRKKVNRIFQQSGYEATSHSGKALLNVLEGFPRDELFHSTDAELINISLGTLQLRKRQRIRLFARRDVYGRFVSIIAHVPRDRYNTAVRKKMELVISKALQATDLEFDVQFSESVFARIHFIIHTAENWDGVFDTAVLETEIVEILRDWKDDLLGLLISHFGETLGAELSCRYGDGFTHAYQENYSARSAVLDVEKIYALDENSATNIQMSLYRPLEAKGNTLQFKLINRGEPAPLSQSLPVLENMGVTVFDEHPYELTVTGDDVSHWVHDFGLLYESDLPAIEDIKDNFQDVFENVWLGRIENDGFNKLVLKANLDWRKIMLLRAIYLYLRQAGITFSQNYIEKTLSNNANISNHLVRLFELRFDPTIKGRDKKIEKQVARIEAEIDKVSSLDEDRILRRYLNLIQSMLRTNFYQYKVDKKGIPCISFKLDPENITELPAPRPKFEIFVYSPRIEGIHLRGGMVARGGLRWSDRREDFRTEVLGLMKAQVSKNAVIVPTGAKGGFIVKRLLDGLSRDEMMEEVIDCYSIFIGSLLDITDNLKGATVVPPSNVVRYDNDDPYLVVAADKGTATFSDIANGIAIEHDFWLGDAFASGGSVGYDHKKMGITAKGAWESVKRHFREIDIDVQTTPFNVVGIGDMGGDVFGNGMLLSEKIRLVGAFNHLHIFLDPDPDPATSYLERKRLFEMPRSSWEDYSTELISKGGAIFSRTDKSITLTPEIKKLLAISANKLTPNALIKAMLKAPVDLLWNGGIGTYVKSAQESNEQVGDRANDVLRIDGVELCCKVVGEGGNLGFTQLGRIEFALQGGRINTDAIDNSAGVDCSDNEVNIKILLNAAVEEGDMTGKQRDKLLAKMTNDVSKLVLDHNYLQTQGLSMIEQQAVAMFEVHARLIDHLCQAGSLDRDVEYLPTNEEIEERKSQGKGLCRPELSVVFAYSKLLLKNQFSDCELLQDDFLKIDLIDYFPPALRDKFSTSINKHRLRNKIVANQLINQLVNRLGPAFAFRMMDEAGARIDEVVKNFKIACEMFNAEAIWKDIEELDNKVPSRVQIDMLMELRKLIERSMFWLQRNRSHVTSISELVNEFSTSVEANCTDIFKHVSALEKEKIEQTMADLQAVGVSKKLAIKISYLELEFSCLDIIAVQSVVNNKKEEVLSAHFLVGEHLQLNWLQNSIDQLPRKNYWQSLARTALRDDLHAESRAVLSAIFKATKATATAQKSVDNWCEANKPEIERYLHLISIIQCEGDIAIEQLSVILKELHAIVEKSNTKQLKTA